ncbi:hypothetical protein [Sphingobium amiense]|uniref:hypothetical protein n=1 Tax=Sphingobium amiense TaxID=135719 RepID=UPI0008306112|nr:hypothetical protein [Sphingobium amiense]
MENLHEAMRSLRSLSAIANLASGRCADLIEGEPTGRERKGSDSLGTMSAAKIERKLSDLKGKIALLIDSPAGV